MISLGRYVVRSFVLWLSSFRSFVRSFVRYFVSYVLRSCVCVIFLFVSLVFVRSLCIALCISLFYVCLSLVFYLVYVFV